MCWSGSKAVARPSCALMAQSSETMSMKTILIVLASPLAVMIVAGLSRPVRSWLSIASMCREREVLHHWVSTRSSVDVVIAEASGVHEVASACSSAADRDGHGPWGRGCAVVGRSRHVPSRLGMIEHPAEAAVFSWEGRTVLWLCVNRRHDVGVSDSSWGVSRSSSNVPGHARKRT